MIKKKCTEKKGGALGKEIQKRRPRLVVTKYDFNRKTMFVVICPITSTIRNLPTHYSLPNELDITVQILISQLKSLDSKRENLKELNPCLYKIWLKSIKPDRCSSMSSISKSQSC